MNIKIKIKYSYVIKMVYGSIAIAFIVVAYLLFGFLDVNFYQVITQAEDIIVLKKEVSSEIVDTALFEKVLAHLNEKQKPLPFDIKNVKDIFNSSLLKQSESEEQNFNSQGGIPSPNGI